MPIPLPADDDDLAAGMASKVVLKNEYGHGRNSSEGSSYHRVPKTATVTLGHARKRVHLDVHGGWSVDDMAA